MLQEHFPCHISFCHKLTRPVLHLLWLDLSQLAHQLPEIMFAPLVRRHENGLHGKCPRRLVDRSRRERVCWR